MTTICPDAGHLRSWLDGEATPADVVLADHLTTCDACQTTLGGLQRDADLVRQTLAARLSAPPSVEETERALGRLRQQLTTANTVAAVTREETAVGAMTQGAMNRAPTGEAGAVGARFIAPENDAPALSQREGEPHPRSIH